MIKKIKIKGIDEAYFYTKLKNGLRVYMMPISKSKRYQISYITNYGGYYKDFKIGHETKYHHLPDGVAHFLEHLLFKEEDGSEVTKEFAKYGTSADASTSNQITRYYIIGSKDFKANLNILLNFVNTPYFTVDNVNKEKGIIIEEIKMGEDDPYRDLYVKAFKNIYYYSNIKASTIGKTSEVRDITVDDISLAYKAFYQPQNMSVVITGNFKVAEAVKAITNNETFKKHQKINLKPIKEPANVKKAYDEEYKNITIPKVAVRVKLPYEKFKNISKVKLKLCLNLLLEAKFGSTSQLNEVLVNQGLIIESLYFAASVEKDGILLAVFFESKTPKKVIEIIKEELKTLRINKDELLRKKRCIISSIILAYDDMRDINNIMISNIANYGEVISNQYEIVKSLTVNEINNIGKKIFTNQNNLAVMVIKPIKKSAK